MAFAPATILQGPGRVGQSSRLLSIQLDPRQLRFIQEQLKDIPNGMPKVVARAINRVLAKERTLILRRLSKTIGISQKLIRPQVKLFKARPKTGIRAGTSLRGKIWIGSHRKALSKLGGRAGRKLLKRARKTTGGAFEATMPSGHKGFFVRKPNWTMHVPRPPGSGIQKHGLPIEELKTESPADVMRREGLDAEAEERINRNLAKRLDHEIKRELEKHAKRGR